MIPLRHCFIASDSMSNVTLFFSDPNGGTSEKIQWKPYHPDNPSYLVIDENLKVENGKINEKRFEFWRNMMKYIKENEMKFSQK